MKRKYMFWTYTLLGIIFGILALVCGGLATYESRKESPSVSGETNTYNIKADYVNRDKTVKPEKINRAQEGVDLKPIINKSETIVNNGGIVNSGVNNGTQTVNTYNEK